MTKKEYSQIIKSFGIKIEDFFLDVGRKPNSLGNIKANEQVPENYIKLLNLYKDKLDKEKLLKERELLKEFLNKNICFEEKI